jgi:hypothetical protein
MRLFMHTVRGNASKTLREIDKSTKSPFLNGGSGGISAIVFSRKMLGFTGDGVLRNVRACTLMRVVQDI